MGEQRTADEEVSEEEDRIDGCGADLIMLTKRCVESVNN